MPTYLRAAAALGVAGALGLLLAVRTQSVPGIAYQTAALTRGPISARVTATGSLSPRVTVQVGSQVSGRVLEVLVDFNSPVRKGEVIARIDPQLFAAEVSRAGSNRDAAAATVQRAEAEFDVAQQRHERTTALAERQLVSQAQIESDFGAYRSAESQRISARAAHGQTRSALQQAQMQLAYTTIVSPIEGVVISRMVEVGQTVAASFQAPQLFTIAEDLHKMEVHTHVAEADVGRIEPGMAAEFSVDAYPADFFHGTVKDIRYSPLNVQNVVTYDAVVSVDNPDLRLRPGMTANVSIRAEERADALLIPNAALRFRPAFESASDFTAVASTERGSQATLAAQPAGAPKRVVWVRSEGNRAQPVEVHVGITDGGFTELVAGSLAEGDVVIVGAIDDTESPTSAPGSRSARGGTRRFMGLP
jgi:HlyD family secretion protein